uniref:Phosphate-regulating neutral endopeptidase (inferred by orthology to a human protein) n=1 Tax=Strongyloides venezuelensis TaxID=75913 RepID=A0A0K0EU59_STRVS
MNGKRKINKDSNGRVKIIQSEYYFRDFYQDVKRGVYDRDSKAIKKINLMRKKCNDIDKLYLNDCIKAVDVFGYYAFAAHYAKLLNDELSKYKWLDVVTGTFNQLKSQLKRMVKARKRLLDRKTKANYLSKIENMSLGIGKLFKEKSQCRSHMEQCYEYFKFSRKENVLDMLQNIRNYEFMLPDKDKKFKNMCLSYIKKSKSGDLRLEDLLYSHTFYLHEQNKLIINPSIFNSLCYNPRYPESLNYGCAGFIIGHEMLHAFDSEGMYLDKHGEKNLKMTSSFSKRIFEKRMKCYKDKYGKNSNVLLTLDEDVSDSGAIKIAFESHLKYCENFKNKELLIPKFEKYTHSQLFFINVARSICSTPAQVNVKLYDNDFESNPKKFRVYKVLSNYKSFSRAFQCGHGTNMNSKHKCRVW